MMVIIYLLYQNDWAKQLNKIEKNDFRLKVKFGTGTQGRLVK